MKVIDSHIHFWDLSNNINNWVFEESIPSLVKNYLPDVVVKNFNGTLDGVVHIQAHDPTVATDVEIAWLDKVMENFPELKYRHIAFADITLPNNEFKDVIAKLKKNKNVVGIRHILSFNPTFTYSPCDSDLSTNNNIFDNLKCLAQNNFIFDCQMYPRQINNVLPAIVDSGVLCVVDHLALPAWYKEGDQDHILWQDTIIKLSRINNIFIKLSGIDMFRKEIEFDSVVEFCLEHVSSNKLIYGSNYPVSFTHDYNYWYEYVNRLNLDQATKEQIFFKNAYDNFFK